MSKISRTLVVALSAALIAVDVVFGIRLHAVASRRIDIKEDFSQVNSFTLGLLSVDVWKSAVQDIVTQKINDFQFSPAQEEILKNQVAQVLKALLNQADVIAQKQQGIITGSLSKSLITTARKNVPVYAQTVLDEIKKPENFLKLKQLAREQFDAYAQATHGSPEDAARLKALLEKYGAADIAAFNATAARQIHALDVESAWCAGILLGSLGLFGLVWWALWRSPELHRALLACSAAFAFVLLATSLSVPMIEIDARLKSVDFQLIGSAVHFNDQVLYYRSKSLLQVVSTLMQTGKVDSMGVGVLLLLFSILFPVAKLVSTELLLLGGPAFKKSRLVEFFALKSGKWSMADVNVVAIFMAFIGFRGIINSQLEGLNMNTAAVDSISTNATTLQPGFYLFTAFVLFSLALSEILKHMLPKDLPKPPSNQIRASHLANPRPFDGESLLLGGR